VKDLAKNTGVVDWRDRKRDFEHLKGIPFPKLPASARISVLVGTDYPLLLHSYKSVPNTQNGADPIGLQTPLGWSCVGRSKKAKDTPTMAAFCSDGLIDTSSWFQNMLFSRNGTESGSKK
jgi:hypothetical protein